MLSRVRLPASGRIWAALALVALLVRAIIPAGYMPVVDRASGEIQIAMCGSPEHAALAAGLARTATPSLASGALPSGPSGQVPDETPLLDSELCPFGLAAASILPEARALQASAAVYAFEYGAALRTAAPALPAWTPNAPPTGPPAAV